MAERTFPGAMWKVGITHTSVSLNGYVLCLGGLNEHQESSWHKTIELSGSDSGQRTQISSLNETHLPFFVLKR